MRVLYVQYTNPAAYPPLVRGSQLLVGSGAEVLMLGTRIRGVDALDTAPTSGVDVRLAAAAPDGWRLKAHYARYAAWVAREGRAWRPDWIYASDLLAAPIALALAAFTGAKVVYHEHDGPAHERQSWTIKRCLEARHRLLRSATLVVVPNAERAARLAALAGRDVFTVWNCPRQPTRRPPLVRTRHSLRLVYRGSINSERLPLATIDALARMNPSVSLDIAGYETAGSRGYLATLASHAEHLRVENRVRVLGTVPEVQLARICEQSDIGLALMPMKSHDENMRHMTGASNKVFEYFSYGVAPLVSDLPDWRRTFVDPGYALACDSSDAASISAAVAWAIEHHDEVRAIAERGAQRLHEDWNYESQFAPVLSAMWSDSGTRARRSPLDAPAEAECAS